MRISIPYFKQDTVYTCGAASLQMALAYWGIIDSEKKLAKMMGTNYEVGTLRSAMEEEARRHGLYVYVNESAHIEEIGYFLHRKIPVVVRFLERSPSQDEHYAVVSGYGPTYITLRDPWHGPKIRYEREHFIEKWKGQGMVAWLMAVAPFDMQLGRQLGPKRPHRTTT